MTRLRSTTSSTALGGLLLLGIAAYIGYHALSGYVSLGIQNHQFWGSTPEQVKSVRDWAYKDICPAWRDKNWFDRNIVYRKHAWCSEYLDRL